MGNTKQFCQKKKMASTLSDDRLSALPDCVLTHILSFLSTKLSVSTSILGKRWRFLWSQVPILDFHSDDYRKKETALSKIINKVMMLHKVTKLETFRLCQEDACCCDFEFEARIATLIDRNVRNLSIYLVDQTKLPLCLFSCKTLVYLTLTGWSVCADIPMTGPVCLPALKKLHLTGVTFAPESTYESLPHLLSGCPVLEELLVHLYGEENTVVICHIASPTLKNLVLISEGSAVFNVKLDTRALRYLKLRGYFKLCGSMSNVSAGALPSLVEADIGIYNGELFNLFPCSVIEFVGKKLPNVKWLKLRTGQLEVHSSAFSALTIKFLNLTELELGTDARFILRFLENADNLQVLTIRKVYGHHLNWTDPKQVPACLASHLRTVKIHSVECTEQELSMMRYILKNAKVLEVMEIYSSLGIDKLQTLQRISTFQQGSETCQVVFT